MKLRVTIRTWRGDLRGELEVGETDPLTLLDALNAAAAALEGVAIVSID